MTLTTLVRNWSQVRIDQYQGTKHLSVSLSNSHPKLIGSSVALSLCLIGAHHRKRDLRVSLTLREHPSNWTKYDLYLALTEHIVPLALCRGHLHSEQQGFALMQLGITSFFELGYCRPTSQSPQNMFTTIISTDTLSLKLPNDFFCSRPYN
jgi:hypothetical protein